MSQSILRTVPLAHATVPRVACKVASKRHVASRVASLDSVASQMEAAGVDSSDAYRLFEELLGTADVSFNQGDKVRIMQIGPMLAPNGAHLCPQRASLSPF